MDSEIFGFVEDTSLKNRMIATLEHVIFLTTLLKSKQRKKAQSYIYKDCIVYIASLIECVLRYKILKGFPDEKFPIKDKDFRDVKEIHRLSPEERIVWGIEKNKEIKITGGTDFCKLNEIAKDKLIIDSSTFESCEEIRKWRNTIHIVDTEEKEIFNEKDLEKASSTLLNLCS
jgi:hypothetical protein